MDHVPQKPGLWPLIPGGLIILIGIGGFVFFLFSSITGITDSLTQVLVPGEKRLTLTESGNYTVFIEHKSVYQGRVYTAGGSSGLQLTVTAEDTGRELEVKPAASSATYNVGGRSGSAVWSFRVDRPGDYIISADYPDGREGGEMVLAVGNRFMKDLMTSIFGGLGILFVALALGTAIIVIVIIRRVRWGKHAPGEGPATFYTDGPQ
ncbi:MAG: hypothetical protein R6V10_12425 [bacterium]